MGLPTGSLPLSEGTDLCREPVFSVQGWIFTHGQQKGRVHRMRMNGNSTKKAVALAACSVTLAIAGTTALSSPASAGVTTGWPTIRQGSTGGYVLVAEHLLQACGYRISATTYYGSHTTALVRHFQRRHGHRATGVIGPRTWAVLDDRCRPKRGGF